MSTKTIDRPTTVMLDGDTVALLCTALAFYFMHSETFSKYRAIALATLLEGSDVDVYTGKAKAREWHGAKTAGRQ